MGILWGVLSVLAILIIIPLLLLAVLSAKKSGNLSKLALSQKWLKVALIGGIILLLLYYWDRINVLVAMWLADSAVGTKFNLEASFIANWLWVPAGLLVAYILYRVFHTNKEGAQSRRSGAPVKDFFNGIIDVIVVTIFLGVIALGVALVAGIVVKVAGIDTTVINVLDSATGKQKVRCTEPKELAPNPRIDRGGRDIVLCARQAGMVFYAYPLAGDQLKVQVSPVFEHKHLLENGRSVWDFVEVNRPGSFAGSTAHSWQIIVKRDVWRFSGLDHIRLHVSAIPSR